MVTGQPVLKLNPPQKLTLWFVLVRCWFVLCGPAALLVASAPSITAVSMLILPISNYLRGPMIAYLICTYIYPNYIDIHIIDIIN